MSAWCRWVISGLPPSLSRSTITMIITMSITFIITTNRVLIERLPVRRPLPPGIFPDHPVRPLPVLAREGKVALLAGRRVPLGHQPLFRRRAAQVLDGGA